MNVLFATGSPARYMRPPQLGDAQVNCGPDWRDETGPDGRVRSLATPVGDYDLAAVAARLPAEQRPDLVVCLVDASWRNVPRNLAAFPCPKVLLIADTHHLSSPLVGTLRYLASEPYDRCVLLYDRHHAAFFHAAGVRNLYWFPGLTFPHDDATVQAARMRGARAARIAFVGQAGRHHPRRARLIEALQAAKLPLDARALGQGEGLGFYGASLLGFNASLNGDFNLRVFEILATGAALLTDRLAPTSGFADLFADGRDCLLYGSPEELAERVIDALARPAATRAIGAAGARWFDEHFNAAKRRAQFHALAFDGTEVPAFAFSEAERARVFFGGDTERVVQAAMVYEGVQEIHRGEERVRVQLSAAATEVRALFATLPRVEFVADAEQGESDLAAFSHAEAVAGVVTNAPMLWCWDARAEDFAGLSEAFGPAGFAFASRDVAVLCYAPPEEPAAPVAADAPRHVVLYTDDPESGGVAQYNHTLLLGLVSAGYRVSCVQSRCENPLIEEQRRHGVAHHWLDYHTGREFARTVTDAAPAERIFAADRPDLIIFSDCCPVSNLAARETALRLGLPYVVVIGFVGTYLAKNFAAQLPTLARHYAAARAVVAVSQDNLGLLRRHFGLSADAGEVVHYGRPEKFFAPRDPAVRARLRAELKLPVDAVVGFTAARLTAIKGYGYQLDAIARLSKDGAAANLHFVWAGDGDQRAALASEIKRRGLDGRVHLLGHRWDVADWYDAADIFVLPSEVEGMPLAIMEAMAKGLPVAATAISGIPEELGDTGKLLPDGQTARARLVSELADTLTQWAGDAVLRARLGAAARARAEAMFREERMIARTLALVRQSLAPAESATLTALST